MPSIWKNEGSPPELPCSRPNEAPSVVPKLDLSKMLSATSPVPTSPERKPSPRRSADKRDIVKFSSTLTPRILDDSVTPRTMAELDTKAWMESVGESADEGEDKGSPSPVVTPRMDFSPTPRTLAQRDTNKWIAEVNQRVDLASQAHKAASPGELLRIIELQAKQPPGGAAKEPNMAQPGLSAAWAPAASPSATWHTVEGNHGADCGLSRTAVDEWLRCIPAGEGNMSRHCTRLYDGGLDSRHAWLCATTADLCKLGLPQAHATRIVRAVLRTEGPQNVSSTEPSDELSEGSKGLLCDASAASSWGAHHSQEEVSVDEAPHFETDNAADVREELAKLKKQIGEYEQKLHGSNTEDQKKHVSEPAPVVIASKAVAGPKRNCQLGSVCVVS